MFFRHCGIGRKTILIVYFDDIIMTRNDLGEIEWLKKTISIEFEVKNLGQMRYFRGMEVVRSKKEISVLMEIHP